MQYYYNPFEPQAPSVMPPQIDYNEQWRALEELRLRKNYEKGEIKKFSLALGIAIVAFVAIQAATTFIVGLFGYTESLTNDPVFLYAYSIICSSVLSVALPFGIVGYYFKKNGQYSKYHIIPSKKLGISKFILWVLFGMMCCIAAQFLVSYFIQIVYSLTGKMLEAPEYAKSNSVFALFMELLATVIVPAITEEFAMRCCSLQLLRKYGKGFAVLCVSVVFGLLHGNIVQFVFAFIIGVILGYVTVMTDSILPAVIIHGANNGLSVTSSVAEYFSGEETSNIVSVVLYVLFAVLGIFATVILAKNKQFKSLKTDNTSVLSFGEKMSAFLFPWMIVPFFILIILTVSSSLL